MSSVRVWCSCLLVICKQIYKRVFNILLVLSVEVSVFESVNSAWVGLYNKKFYEAGEQISWKLQDLIYNFQKGNLSTIAVQMFLHFFCS
jgi:hypothetical protein